MLYCDTSLPLTLTALPRCFRWVLGVHTRSPSRLIQRWAVSTTLQLTTWIHSHCHRHKKRRRLHLRNEDVLVNACKHIDLIEKSKYTEIRLHRGMMENEQITVGSTSYIKVNIWIFRLIIDKWKFYSGANKM